MDDPSRFGELLKRGVFTRTIQLPPDACPLDSLRKIISQWPESPPRSAWLKDIDQLESSCREFELAKGFDSRKEVLGSIQQQLKKLGVGESNDSQRLYSARMPINEDCRLGCKELILGKPFVEQLLVDAAPWFDLWRDLAGLYATRLHQGMKEGWKEMGEKPIPLPLFLPAILKAWGRMSDLDKEIQEAWAKQLGDRFLQPVVSLTEDDTAFIRKGFQFKRMKAFDNMSPDLQVVAADEQAMAEGQWNLLIAEIHPDFTPWENCFFLWCQNPEAFAADYASEGGQGHAVVIGNSLPYFGSAHTSLCVYPHAHKWTVLGGAAPEGVESVRSADAFVVVTDDDVVVQDENGKPLGSFLHTWQTALNTHRVDLQGSAPHSPRLQVGKVIVQRESWKIQPDPVFREAMKEGGLSAYSALREFRQTYGLPERVYLRGLLPQRMSLEKDVKPIYHDFRNPLLAEIAGKTIPRFDSLLITEMLPDVGECWLKGPGGFYSSEFRTVVMASRSTRSKEG